MNRTNLQRIADHTRIIPQEMFGMFTFRKGQRKDPECSSVGCVIGHATVLDRENVLENFTIRSGHINFTDWSEEFTGLGRGSGKWIWCFSGVWSETDNTPEGAALRIEYLIKNGLPSDCYEQMYGSEPLIYLK